MKYAFIARHRSVWPVRTQCQMLQVSHGGFYEWQSRSPSKRQQDNDRLTGLVRQSFAMSDRTYGSPRVWRDLLEWGEKLGENRVARLMRLAHLQARHKRRRFPADVGLRLEHCIAPNVLDRQFAADGPNRKWAADFTYLWSAEGWLYVSVVLDLFSRKVVGWSMQPTMTAQLVTDALMMALWRRGKAHGVASSLGPGQSIHERGVPAIARRPGHCLQHEQERRLLGQRCDGKLLLFAEDREDQQKKLPNPRPGTGGRVRLH